MTTGHQSDIDANNAQFWSELCGSSLARAIGVTDASADSLARFDRAYLHLYPYLERYLPWRDGQRVLEIGLGYGTVGGLLAGRGLDYRGLDIAPAPVAMMEHRIRLLGATGSATQGSALHIPHPDSSFDVVVSIGCLHHTGNLAGAIDEVHRVLRPGGEAMLMVYNAHSYRRLLTLPARAVVSGAWRDSERRRELVRGAYDSNEAGDAAPVTEFVGPGALRTMLSRFTDVQVCKENAEALVLGWRRLRRAIPREWLLPTLGRVLGLDLYVTLRK
jgi:SAM-dependent methyltransferase